MDDSWGNILYLIVMALFVIVGALKKKKPPVAVSPPNEEEDYQQDTPKATGGFESLFDTLMGNEISTPYIEPIEDAKPVREETMMEEYARLENSKAEARGDEKDSALSALKVIYSEEQEQIESDENQLEEIDWRQAIIYKEILDRKYN